MRRENGLNRRSFVHRVTGAALGVGSLLAAEAKAQGVTDSDSGPNSDRAGEGRGQANTSATTENSTPDYNATPSYNSEAAGVRPLGFVLLIAGAGAAAAGTYMRRKKP